MFPLRDDVPSRSLPVMTGLMIAACVVVFLSQMANEQDGDRVTAQYAMTPVLISHGNQPLVVERERSVRTRFGIEVRRFEQRIEPTPIAPLLTMLTCVFLHGGIAHIAGNMWFLWIFGDNVEDRYGHFGFLLMYLGCGVAASAVHFVSDPQSTIPTVGASGAIAGVMGAYLVLYPQAQVMTLIPLGLFSQVMYIPAIVFHGLWFLLQASSALMTQAGAGGVAWWAHIGGFVVGAGLTMVLRSGGWLAPPRAARGWQPLSETWGR